MPMATPNYAQMLMQLRNGAGPQGGGQVLTGGRQLPMSSRLPNTIGGLLNMNPQSLQQALRSPPSAQKFITSPTRRVVNSTPIRALSGQPTGSTTTTPLAPINFTHPGGAPAPATDAPTAAPTSVAPSGNVVGPVGFTTAFTNALADNPALAVAPLGMVALTAMAVSNMNAPDNSVDADGPAPGSAVSAADAATAAANAVAADGPAPGSGDGGGGGGGGSKIVCTAMNQAYGFGSFRQAIWLEYSAVSLTKQHERGYHRIFKPLVKYAFYSGDGILKRQVRVALEKLMRLRTADLRAEMRGKNPHPIQRCTRRTCEWVCYVVGNFSKGV